MADTDTPGKIGIREEFFIYYDENGDRRAVSGFNDSNRTGDTGEVQIADVNSVLSLEWNGENDSNFIFYNGSEPGGTLQQGKFGVWDIYFIYGAYNDDRKRVDGELDYIKTGVGDSLSASNVTDGIRLDWTTQEYQTHLSADFDIWKREDSESTFSNIATTTGAKYVDENVVDGTKYHYYATFNLNTTLGTESKDSSEVTHTYGEPQQGPNASPNDLFLGDADQVKSTLKATWTNTESTYDIEVQLQHDDGGWRGWDSTTEPAGSSKTEFGGTEYQNGDYRFKARYTNSEGDGPWSDLSNVHTID